MRKATLLAACWLLLPAPSFAGDAAAARACERGVFLGCLEIARGANTVPTIVAFDPFAVALEAPTRRGWYTEALATKALYLRDRSRRGELVVVEALRRVCAFEGGSTCLSLGRREKAEGNWGAARALFREACLRGQDPRCSNLGNLDPDADDYYAALQTLCRRGDDVGCLAWADAYRRTYRTGSMLEAMEKACDWKHALSCFRRARAALNRKQLPLARHWYRRACRLGDGLSCKLIPTVTQGHPPLGKPTIFSFGSFRIKRAMERRGNAGARD